MLANQSRFLHVALLALGVSFTAVACSSEESGDGGDGNGCTPGSTATCDCPGGEVGVQTCSSDGRSFSQCECGGGTGGSGGMGTNDDCGNGMQDAGEACDDGGESATCNTNCTVSSCGDGVVNATAGESCDKGNEFDCPDDCGIDGGGGAGGAPPSCDEVITYAGMTDIQPSVWDSGANLGLDAGDDMCNAAVLGSHACRYADVLQAEAKGELAAIAQDTTAWIHRSTPAMVNAAMSDPGPGGRCNDWTYETNHLSDGEYVSFDTAGMPSYHLDSNTMFPLLDGGGNPVDANGDPVTPPLELDGNGQKVLPCGSGTMRNILCCYPCEE